MTGIHVLAMNSKRHPLSVVVYIKSESRYCGGSQVDQASITQQNQSRIPDRFAGRRQLAINPAGYTN